MRSSRMVGKEHHLFPDMSSSICWAFQYLTIYDCSWTETTVTVNPCLSGCLFVLQPSKYMLARNILCLHRGNGTARWSATWPSIRGSVYLRPKPRREMTKACTPHAASILCTLRCLFLDSVLFKESTVSSESFRMAWLNKTMVIVADADIPEVVAQSWNHP